MAPQSHTKAMDVYTHMHMQTRARACVHRSTHSRTWKCAMTSLPTREWATPKATRSVQSCMCMCLNASKTCAVATSPRCSLCSPKLREAEEKGFASSPLAAKMTALLWQVLLMWDLSGCEIRGQFLLL